MAKMDKIKVLSSVHAPKLIIGSDMYGYSLPEDLEQNSLFFVMDDPEEVTAAVNFLNNNQEDSTYTIAAAKGTTWGYWLNNLVEDNSVEIWDGNTFYKFVEQGNYIAYNINICAHSTIKYKGTAVTLSDKIHNDCYTCDTTITPGMLLWDCVHNIEDLDGCYKNDDGSITITPELSDNVTMAVPNGVIPAGTYEVAIEVIPGSNITDINKYDFSISIDLNGFCPTNDYGNNEVNLGDHYTFIVPEDSIMYYGGGSFDINKTCTKNMPAEGITVKPTFKRIS